MINLNKFSMSKEAKVPIIKGTFQYDRKSYTIPDVRDGWYSVTLKDNIATVNNEIIPEVDLNINKKQIIKGYTYNNQLIFFNFNEGKKRTGWEMIAPLRLNNLSTFSSIEAIIWEDSFLYFYRQSYTDYKIFDLKHLYENEQKIEGVKELTPEMKSLYLFHQIERDQQRALIKRIQEEKERAEKQAKIKKIAADAEEKRKREAGNVHETLIKSFTFVGATVSHFEVRNDRIYVEWSIDGERFSSSIDKNTFKIIDSGFCMSGDDRRHNIKSMVLTAQNYMDRDVLHKWSH
jgi:hypothetical protein